MIVTTPLRGLHATTDRRERHHKDPRALGATVCCVCEKPLDGNHHCKRAGSAKLHHPDTDPVAHMLSPEYLNDALALQQALDAVEEL
jgi:hypothetical protein